MAKATNQNPCCCLEKIRKLHQKEKTVLSQAYYEYALLCLSAEKIVRGFLLFAHEKLRILGKLTV
jgi:hypothetical protein